MGIREEGLLLLNSAAAINVDLEIRFCKKENGSLCLLIFREYSLLSNTEFDMLCFGISSIETYLFRPNELMA